jgi:hypothetical protein
MRGHRLGSRHILLVLALVESRPFAQERSEAPARLLALRWLSEVAASELSRCSERLGGTGAIELRIGERGYFAAKKLTGNSGVDACLKMLVVRFGGIERFEGGYRLVVELPEPPLEGGIYDYLPLRPLAEPYGGCLQHADCGAGQGCIRNGFLDAGVPDGGGICVDVLTYWRSVPLGRALASRATDVPFTQAADAGGRATRR